MGGFDVQAMYSEPWLGLNVHGIELPTFSLAGIDVK
jgi:hypothetical protein